MLQRIGAPEPGDAVIPVGEADFPQPFPYRLEYCPPVYESWNIVHIGMLLPEAHQIYVCAENCMRGVTMTAAEMGESERFHCVLIEEKDMLHTSLEVITVEGVSDVLRKLETLPPAVLVFTVCVHHFLGSDIDYIYRELERRFPTVTFIRCWMDPVMQKLHLPPDVTERAALLDAIPAQPAEPDRVALLGADLPHDTHSELWQLLESGGRTVCELPRCRTYRHFLDFGKAALNVVTYPPFLHGGRQFAQRLGRALLYLPPSFHYDEIDGHLAQLAAALSLPAPNTTQARARCETALAQTRELLGDIPVYVDYMAYSRPLGLAKLLLEHGFRVERVYLDSISPEEQSAFCWLQVHAPDLRLCSTIRPVLRALPRGGEPVLAIGPKAAYYADTPYFVDVIECQGGWGYAMIEKLCQLLQEARREKKDTRRLVLRKGAGCNSCL